VTTGDDPGESEWLEAGPPSPVRPRTQRTIVVLLIVAVALVVVVSAVMYRPDGQEEARRAARSPTPSAVSPTFASSPRRTQRTTDLRPRVLTQRAKFLTGGDWEVFARSSDTVYRIELRTGRITATGGVSSQSDSPTSFVAVPGAVVVRPLDTVPGFLVPDGRPARPLSRLLSNGGQVLPGPADRLWMSEADGSQSTMTLTDVDGDPTGTVVRSAGTLSPDGSGGLLMTDVGGVWEVRADLAPHRITRGVVIAVGPHHYLTVDCDAEHRCSRYRHDKRTHRPRRLGPTDTHSLPDGTISPDGRFAALASWNSGGEVTVSVQDLDSGRTLTTIEMSDTSYLPGAAVFSPDSRHLVGLRDGRIFVLDLRTGRTAVPDLDLPDLIELTARIDR
jgi:hypothetical protein